VDATEIAKQFPSILGKDERLFRKMENYIFHTIKNKINYGDRLTFNN